ncbi:hypothetical protein ACOMHN_067562 [Nucella lapillus]
MDPKVINALIRTPHGAPHNICHRGGDHNFILHTPAEWNSFLGSLERLREGGKSPMTLTESQNPPDRNGGIFLDFDILTAAKEFQYVKVTKKIIEVVYDALKSQITDLADSVEFFVLHRREPSIRKATFEIPHEHWKCGLHILLPGVRVTKNYKKVLIDTMRKNQLLVDVFESAGVINASDVVDLGSSSVPVHLYGIPSRPGSEYELSSVFRVFDSNDRERLDFRNTPLIPELSLTSLGDYYHVKPVEYKSYNVVCEVSTPLKGHDSEMWSILDMLPPEYYNDYTKWTLVLIALRNSKNDEYRSLAERFSMKSAKWDTKAHDMLEALWSGNSDICDRPLKEASIYFWAKKADPETYASVRTRFINERLHNATVEDMGHLTHFGVATVLFENVKDTVVTENVDGVNSSGQVSWWHFTGHRWEKNGVLPVLHHKISTDITGCYLDLLSRMREKRRKYVDAADARNSDIVGGFIKALSSNIRLLKMDGFKNSVIHQTGHLLNRTGFSKELDASPYHMCVNNGLLELPGAAGVAPRLITGFHEIPVSLSSSTKYIPFDPKNPITLRLLSAIKNTIPELDARLWIMMYLATGLVRNTKAPLMLLWVGSGSNGKTTLLKLVAEALGSDYAAKLNIGLLTAERESADRANSAMMNLKRKGYGYFEESNHRESLNSARLKELAGSGDVTCRELYKKQETFSMNSTLVAASNYEFLIRTTDHGTWRRIRYYHSRVCFCDNPIGPWDRKVDARLIGLIEQPQYRAAFLSILVHFWERLLMQGGDITKIKSQTIEALTEEYRAKQDSLMRFIRERVVISKGAMVNVDLLVQKYVQWYSHTVAGSIQGVRISADEVAAGVENSALEVKILNGARVIVDVRLLLPDEQPGPDETPFFQEHQETHDYRQEEPEEWWDAV